jgi:hypothetical protein
MNRIITTYALAMAVALTAACSKDEKAPNTQPEISRISAAPEVVAPGAQAVVAVSASDPDGDALGYEWTVPAGWTVVGAATGASVVIAAPTAFAQTAIVAVKVTDGRGGYQREQVTLRTSAANDRSVSITSVAAVPSPVAPGGTVALAALAQSTATTSITYAWSVDDAAWTITGNGASATLAAPLAWNGLATVTVTASDGGATPATAKVVVSTPPTSPPTISALTAAPTTVGPGGTVGLSAVASGAMGLGVTYSWSIAGAGWTVSGSGASATASAPLARSSLAAVTVTVTDSAGASASRTGWIATSDAPMTTITDVIALPNPAGPGGTVALDAYVETLSTSSITWTWSVDDAAWTIGGTGASATLVAPTAWGASATVSVTADDGSGAPATAKVVVATAATTPPTISELIATPATVNPGGAVALSSIASAAHGLDLTHAWSVVGAGWSVTGTGASATATAPLARSVPAVVTLTVTDAAGASASRTVSVSTNDAPTTTVSAALAGTPPLLGIVGSAVALDASGSSSTGGGTLTYSWRISSAPVGPAAVLAPTGTGATASLTGTVAGSYGVEVKVTDAEGASATASTVVQLETAAAAVADSGDAQSATVGTSLALPLTAVIQTGSGAAAPGAPVTWRIAGGTLLTSDAVSDADGVVHATVKVGRIAGPGTVTVALTGDPATQVTFTFTAAAGAPAAIAVSAGQGVVGTGAVVRVRVVDAYGNAAPGGAADDDQFSLAASSGALFGADVEGGVGTLVSGGGTGSIVGQLVGGQLDIRLNHTKVDPITLSLKVASGLTTPLPYSGWQTLLFDSANRGFATGWSTTADVAPWQVVTGAKAATPARGFGVELTAPQALAPGQSRMTYSLGALAVPAVRLDFVHQATVTSAYDAGAHCLVQPALYVAMRSGSGAESPDRPAPLDGWPVADPCDGRAGFATTTGFVPVTFDLTDAADTGYSSLSFELSNVASPLTPVAAASWYVDDVLVEAFKTPIWTGSTITVRLAAGAPASVALSSTGAPAQPLYRSCRTDSPAWDVTAKILDAWGNLTDESTLAFRIGWTGSPTAVPMSGEMLEVGSSAGKIRFEAGQATIRFTDAVTEGVTVTLFDPDANGLTLGGGLSATLGAYRCHSTGTGYNWSDFVALGTMNSTQGFRACETHYGAGLCSTWNGNVYPYGYGNTCTAINRWAYYSNGGPCATYYSANVYPGYWSNFYYNGSGYTCTSCYYEANYGWVQTSGTVGWY